MRAGRLALAVACGLLGVLLLFTIGGMLSPDDDLPPPAPVGPTMPAGMEAHRLPLDGQLYRCVVYYTEGVDCDWDHPIPQSTPTPGATP